jgi:hypothetical protein
MFKIIKLTENARLLDRSHYLEKPIPFGYEKIGKQLLRCISEWLSEKW